MSQPCRPGGGLDHLRNRLRGAGVHFGERGALDAFLDDVRIRLFPFEQDDLVRASAAWLEYRR